MYNGNTSFELGSLAFWQVFRAYSAEQQSHSKIREEVTAEVEYQPSRQERTSLFGRQASGSMATSYRTSPAGAK